MWLRRWTGRGDCKARINGDFVWVFEVLVDELVLVPSEVTQENLRWIGLEDRQREGQWQDGSGKGLKRWIGVELTSRPSMDTMCSTSAFIDCLTCSAESVLYSMS